MNDSSFVIYLFLLFAKMHIYLQIQQIIRDYAFSFQVAHKILGKNNSKIPK